MVFEKFGLEHREILDARLARTTFNGSTFSYAYLMGWKYFNYSGMRIAVTDTALYLRFEHKGEPNYITPLCPTADYPRAVEELRAHCHERGEKMRIVQAERDQADSLDPSRYAFETEDAYAEYLYLPSDIIELKGKKYHAKRNHIAKFKSLYDHEFRAYAESDRTGVEELFEEWKEAKGEEENEERKVIALMLDNLSLLRLKACVLLVDGVIVGFTIGELTANGLAIVHIEKGNIAYEGVYAAINQLFAERELSAARLINRQEDMGIEGLRKAKRSYYPVSMSEKWVITC